MTIYKALCVELLKEWDNAPTPSDIIDTDVFGVIRKIRTALKTEETMTENHPITVPTGSITCWRMLYRSLPPAEKSEVSETEYIATQAARWGADQELEACCKWVGQFNYDDYSYGDRLQAARRRPKPPSLKEQALKALNEAIYMADDSPPEGITLDQASIIRHALEQLDD